MHRRETDFALALLALGAMAAVAAVLFASGSHRLAILAFALASAPSLVFVLTAAARADRYASSRALARYVQASYPGASVLVFEDYERLSTLPFYLRAR